LKLYSIPGTPPPDTPTERVRKRMRDSARHWPHCPRCGGRETVSAKIGNVRSNLCVCCLMRGERVVIE
jgi:hypothetical protein